MIQFISILEFDEVCIMIKKVEQSDIVECVNVIRESFLTVANEFGFTLENAPRFTAFATTEKRLHWHLVGENRPMYAFWDNGNIVGYYSLLIQDNNQCELNNLCVVPTHRHKGIGNELLKHAFKIAKELNCNKINIGIVEENKVLRKWYESFDFVHIGTQKFDFFPFTCGYMEKIYNGNSNLSKREDETCSQIVPNDKRGARTPFFSRVLTSLGTSSPIFRSWRAK